MEEPERLAVGVRQPLRVARQYESVHVALTLHLAPRIPLRVPQQLAQPVPLAGQHEPVGLAVELGLAEPASVGVGIAFGLAFGLAELIAKRLRQPPRVAFGLAKRLRQPLALRIA